MIVQVEGVRGGGVPVQAPPGGAGEDKPTDPGVPLSHIVCPDYPFIPQC